MKGLSSCTITVIKKLPHKDLIREYIADEFKEMNFCECFQEGQEFVIKELDDYVKPPEGFCPWAWADIRKEIMNIASGGNMVGLKKKGVAVCGCSDWFRPVIFRIERED